MRSRVPGLLLFAGAATLAFGQSEKALSAVSASAIALHGAELVVGDTEGNITRYNAATREPLGQFGANDPRPVSLVAMSEFGTAWIVGGRPAGIRDRVGQENAPAEQKLYVRDAAGALTTIDLRPAGVTQPVRSIAWVGHRLFVTQEFGAIFFNAKSKAIELPEAFLPKALAADIERSRVYVNADPTGSTVVIARPHALRRHSVSATRPYVSMFTAYRYAGDAWRHIGGLASNSLDLAPINALVVSEDGRLQADTDFRVVSETVAASQEGFVALEGENLLVADVMKPDWESKRLSLPLWSADREFQPDPLWVGASGNYVWWWTGSALIRQEKATGTSSAHLPWLDSSIVVNAIAVDDNGAWIATTKGVRRVNVDKPDSILGHGGFIALDLGKESLKPQTKGQTTLSKELYQWRFAPADVAGEDGAKMISEIFRGTGVRLPNTYEALLVSRDGSVVRDRIQFGDVIFSEGKAAIYVGDGKTIELVAGVVRNGTVWTKSNASVRRYLKG